MNEHIAIVGGGIAGLTAGIYAAKAGKQVTLFEKNEKCGGLVNSFVRDGFLFDGGTRALEGFIFPLLKNVNISIDYIKTPVSIGIENKIIRIESESDIAIYRKLLEDLYPESYTEIDRIFKPIYKMGKFLKGVNKVLSTNKGFRAFVTEKIPGIFSLVGNISVLIKMNTPIERYFETVLGVKNQGLIDIIIQHFFKGTPAFFALGYLYLYPDYIYLKGGTGMLAKIIEDKAREVGVAIKTGTKIKEVLPAEKTIIDDSGVRYQYDTLIWTADLKMLYRNVKTEGLVQSVQKKIIEEKEKILAHKGAESIFTLFVAVDEKPEYFNNISSGHLFYTPSKKGLGSIIREEQEYIVSNWNTLTKSEIIQWLEKLIRYNTFEIAIPVLKDPQAAPPHKTGVIISFLFPYEVARLAKEDGWYEELKETVSKFIIKTISESLYKNWEEKILFTFASTPLSIEEVSGCSEGAVIGWSMEKPIPVNSSMLKMTESVKTALPNILKAGQWTMSPAGIPTAIMTGQIAANTSSKKRIR